MNKKFQPEGEFDEVEVDAELGALNVAKVGGGGTLFKVPAAPTDGFEAIFYCCLYFSLQSIYFQLKCCIVI